ncbi:hypothetical protein NBRC10513_005417 [Rhodotorula toruloides]
MASARGRRAHAGLGQAAAGALSLARTALALRQTRSLPRPHPHRSPLRDGLTQPHTHPGDVQRRTQLPEQLHRPPVPPPTPLAATASVNPPPTSLPDDRPSPPPFSAHSASAPQPESRSPAETPLPAQLPLDPVDSLDSSSPRSHDAASPSPSPVQLDLPAKETVLDDIQEEYTEPQLAADAIASKVPSSRFGRLMHYGGLAATLGVGMASEAFRRSSSPSGGSSQSLLMSEANLERLVAKLSKMRGAALKLGQFLSIQDTKQLPPQLEAILQRVQNSANFMPEWQTAQVLADNLGDDWQTHFEAFDMRPFAAASIGQVHRAKLAKVSPLRDRYNGLEELAVKVQFPGVRQSITSDLGTLRWLLVASAALPRGLYLDNTLRVLGRELEDECDYLREAQCGRKMRDKIASSALADSFDVPEVVDELCGPMVLTTRMMTGRPLKDVFALDQATRDEIGTRVMQLCMYELFDFRLMQTDPNWSNFLYNPRTRKLELVDFGATREYSADFMRVYGDLLDAAIAENKDEAIQLSQELGYLTGEEGTAMVDAHLESLFSLATPFRDSAPSPFPFGRLGPPITARIRQQIPIMLKHRLKPPPEETYSLNRKLSGAFLLCERLDSHVPVGKLYRECRRFARCAL